MDKTGAEKWRRSKQQVASLALGCLLMLIPPSKCQSTQQQQLHRPTALSEHDHLQLMMQTSANNRLVNNDYQIHNKLTNDQHQQQSWTPLRALKADSPAGAKSLLTSSSLLGHEPMRTAESAQIPTGLLVSPPQQQQQQQQHQQQQEQQQQQQQLATSSSETGRRQTACAEKTSATHPQTQETLLAPTAERLINRRHVQGPQVAHLKGPAREQSKQQQQDEQDDEDEEEEENEGTEPPATRGVNGTTVAGEPLHGHESVSLESSMAPPGLAQMNYNDQNQPDDYQQEPAMHSRRPGREHPAASADEEQDEQPEGGGGGGGGAEAPPDEAAERREQEAAEASEAEAANKSALDEQQQAQREIIMAQAQSEAKAIKEQQEALLKQQQLQQQMLLRRHQNDLDMTRPRGDELQQQQQQQVSEKAGHNNKRRLPAGSKNREYNSQQWMDENDNEKNTRQYNQQTKRRHHQHTYPRTRIIPDMASTSINWEGSAAAAGVASTARRQPTGHLDIQFSDDQSGASAGKQQISAPVNQEDELGVDYSIRRATVSSASPPPASSTSGPVEFAPANLIGGADLLPAAQHHHYGAHYGSLGGHHGSKGQHYYQFAHSHKKGQFDSGFKRGGKKFHISGHASQHKSHAEGHVKWHAKKGKGMHYWDYKHKGGKKYGRGHDYGLAYHHY